MGLSINPAVFFIYLFFLCALRGKYLFGNLFFLRCECLFTKMVFLRALCVRSGKRLFVNLFYLSVLCALRGEIPPSMGKSFPSMKNL